MFFVLSKTIGRLADPVVLSCTLLALAVLLRLFRRARRLRVWFTVIGTGLLVLLSMGFVSNALLAPLEGRHPRPAALREPPGAIVMLSGLLESARVSPADYELSSSSDRFVETLRLARKFPHALVVLSGGSGSLSQGGRREAEILARLAPQLGLDVGRLRIDKDSRNTRENASNSKRLLQDVRGPVLLVTSASHMWRSMGCFRKVGLKVTPWPVDYERTRPRLRNILPGLSSLQKSQQAIREYVGLVAYRLAGYI